MKIEQGQISSSQLIFLNIGFMQGAHLLLAFSAAITKHDTWLTVLAAMVVSLPFVLLYGALAQRFPGKNLVEIHDAVYGPFLGKVISVLYIAFFLLLAALNLRTVCNFFGTYIMPETPMAVFSIMFVFICSWAVRKGLETIARSSFILMTIAAVLIFLGFMLLLKDMDFSNFLPVFELPVSKFIQGTHIVATLPFTQTVVFLMVMPYMNKIKQAKKALLLGFLFGGLQLLIIVVQDTAVLGAVGSIMVSPSFEATRLINIADILTRLDVLVAIVLLVTLFLRVSVYYYATVLGIAQLLKLRSYLPIVTPIGIITISLSALLYGSSMEHAVDGASIYPFYSLPFQFLLPVVSWLVAMIRRVPKQQEGKKA